MAARTTSTNRTTTLDFGQPSSDFGLSITFTPPAGSAAGTLNKDYVGINIHVYDPIIVDPGAHGGCTNIIGVDPDTNISYTNGVISSIESSASVLPVLNAHRNGHWGYSSWKQIRAHENPLSRFYRKNNVYTFLQEPTLLTVSEPFNQTTTTTFTDPVRS